MHTIHDHVCTYMYITPRVVHFSAFILLFMQLSQCLEDFESLVGLAMSLLDGQEPTSTMLFGTDSKCSNIHVHMYMVPFKVICVCIMFLAL